MDSTARDVKRQRIGNDQSYEWGIIESKFGKVERYAIKDYHWHGEVWQRVIDKMKLLNMKSTSISFYMGASIDEKAKTVKVRGEFVRDFVSDKHRFFWSAFFNCPKDVDPIIISTGKFVKLPNIAGDNDELEFYVCGQNVNQMLSAPEAEDEE